MPIIVRGSESQPEQSFVGAYDISNAVYNNESFDISKEDSSPLAIEFNSDGSKVFMVGSSNKAIFEYNLSTPYDISTSSYSEKSFTTNNETNTPNDIAWKPDGSKFFVLGGADESIYEYNVSTPYDVSTASYSGKSLSVTSEDSAPFSIAWNDDGSKIFMVGNSTDSIYQYTVSTPYDISTASYSGKSFGIGTEEPNPFGIKWKPDGSKVFLLGLSNDNIYEYNLSTNYDISTASYEGKFYDVGDQDSTSTGIEWNNDGTKIFMVGVGGSIFEYDILPVMFSYTGNSFDVSNQESKPYSIHFKPNGTKMWVIGFNSKEVHEYQLSNPWDTNTLTFTGNSFSVSSEDNVPTSIHFKPDGSKMWMTGGNNGKVYQYNLTTPWDITTSNYNNNKFSISNEDSIPNSIHFKPDGTKMYVIGNQTDTLYEYNLTTPWDITTTNYMGNSFDVSDKDSVPQSIHFKSNGRKIWLAGISSGKIYEYNLSTPWDITTMNYSGNRFDLSNEEYNPRSIYFKPNDEKMWLVGDGVGEVHEYDYLLQLVS